jgi:hypothetical protein
MSFTLYYSLHHITLWIYLRERDPSVDPARRGVDLLVKWCYGSNSGSAGPTPFGSLGHGSGFNSGSGGEKFYFNFSFVWIIFYTDPGSGNRDRDSFCFWFWDRESRIRDPGTGINIPSPGSNIPDPDSENIGLAQKKDIEGFPSSLLAGACC